MGESSLILLRKIFESMEYGQNSENTEKTQKWIKDNEITFFAYTEKSNEKVNGAPIEIKNLVNNEILCTVHVPEMETIQIVVDKSYGKIKWFDTNLYERAQKILNFSKEIDKNSDTLSQIESLSRGLLTRETKKGSVKLLSEYISYYSNYVKYGGEKSDWKPEGLVAGFIPNESPLAAFGMILGPALSAGYNIVLQVGSKISIAAFFIEELSRKAGIPEGVIRIVPSDDTELSLYLNSDKVIILTLFANLNDKKFRGVNCCNKKILNLASYETPMIVFDDADLDSAAENAISAAWSYQNSSFWPVKTLLVQENIFDVFLNKLKHKMDLVKIGPSDNKMTDIPYPDDKSITRLSELVDRARTQGIEVFQAKENWSSFSPTLLIGGKVQMNNALSDKSEIANAVTVLAFRSVDEAINLANNTKQGLGASVWSDNIGVINETSRKLKVCNVWVNSHGLTSPDVTLAPIKDSGVGYFGGEEGFLEYAQIKKTAVAPEYLASLIEPKPELTKVINLTKKAQEGWAKVSNLKRAEPLRKFADFIYSNRKDLSSKYKYGILDIWISSIYDCITETNKKSIGFCRGGYNLTSFREPLGVVVIETNELSAQVNLILTAVIEGNSVILINFCKIAESFYEELTELLPKNVLNIVPYDASNVVTAYMHREVNGYFSTKFDAVLKTLPLRETKISTNLSLGGGLDNSSKVTRRKNVWTNVGKSSTCNLSNY